MKRPMVEGLCNVIETLLTSPGDSDDDKLLFSALAEVKEKLSKALDNVSYESRLGFSPTQAMALRILFTDYYQNPKSYIGNHLHHIATEVYNLYQTPQP